MPRVNLDCPRATAQHSDVKAKLIEAVRTVVALHMSGRNYAGIEFALKSEDVDVLVVPYDDDNAVFSARYPLTVIGYDYPERMEPEAMTQKTRSIVVGMELELPRLLTPSYLAAEHAIVNERRQALFDVTFIPYGRGCYASSQG